MSHNIQKNDSCVTLESTWHGLEKIVPFIDYKSSGLDWKVEKHKIMTENGIDINGYEAVIRPDKELTLNVAKDSYTLIQNEQLFEIISEGLTGINHKIVSAGSLGDCRKIYISVELCGHQDYLVNGDKFKNILSFVSSHDGSMALEAYDSSIRVVCANTLQWSRKQKGLLNLKVRHTQNSQLKIEGMKETIEKLFKKRESFYETYAGLCVRPMDSKKAEQIIAGFLAKGEDMSTRAYNQTQEITQLFRAGLGNKGETQADLLNAVTEYYTRGGENKAKSFASSEFGSARDRKLDFFELMTDGEIDKIARRGEATLATV